MITVILSRVDGEGSQPSQTEILRRAPPAQDDESLAPLPEKHPDPIAVLLLNLFLFGAAGYLRIGQREKAIVAAVIWFALAWPTCFSASLAFAVVAAIDGYLQAQQLAAGHPLAKWSFFNQT